MPDATIYQIGNLTADPELRQTPNGVSVAQFSVASTPRVYDKQAQEWKDGETTFLRAQVWRELAEGATNELRKGDQVIVVGKLKQRKYDKDGETRTAFEVEADFVGKSVRARKQRQDDGWSSSASDEAPF
ncbi:single-stranded DNA-binding protein [Mycobacteroides abscessus subsp. abscessus]|uniref:Single-stranded DNA-binding protein n=1 Tax=Mycobacteroides abscessus subsp. abscessus TaxID=1185650 RepID=A0AB38D1E1_9MYCO|nr:single-stranded DNA-binding protein [Mycobacteroides abscessus]SHQ57141.1 single-stranded DNA-binding protein [Mycobacteroides abscessus subsp. abscessus]SHY18171.1 single-stranded DNA-binding protein [Mycobacteroides abscessus subsp. abscessus]SIA06777.1 single-stranded DNA-binding protein [Mycobacteroides abscessus subsp. abscessus]SIA17411.1 single-stranded DNA-binding protein [Mycobacteroides abscessus subsp. abscessus]SIB09820.1 single-stranded DNA-binding protein [Mycobacteroides absc